MIMALLLAACGAGDGETIDMVDGTYVGLPAGGDLADGIRVTDEETTITIRFKDEDSELWADVSLRGEVVALGITFTAEDSTIEGVTVDGDDLACKIDLGGFVFNVVGLFADARASLVLDIEGLGAMTLFLEAAEEPVEEDAGETSDTGAG